MPNSLAYLALVIWPLVVVVLFRRYPPTIAVIWSILGGYLFLPPVVNIDLPVIPPLDKSSIPVFTAWLAAWGIRGKWVPLLPPDWPGRIAALVFLLWPLPSIIGNPEPIARVIVGEIPGLRLYDAVSFISRQVFMLMMMGLGREFLSGEESRRQLVKAFMLAGLVYTLPMLLEIRLSPQLNTWIYGFFQHDFQQMMREGGFRPIVFLDHGLWVAFFTVMALLCTVMMARYAELQNRTRLRFAVIWIFVVLVLCKSLGSLMFALLLVPVTALLSPKTQLRLALLMGAIAVLYPIWRTSPLFPHEALVNWALSVSADRAQSLEYRLDNEAVLVQRAFEKAWTGWGGFGRNLLYDPDTGRATTVTDGRWIITLGTLGWPGFLAEFGLMLLPLLQHAFSRKTSAGPATAVLALILGVNMIDMLPNASLTPLTWLIVGALTPMPGRNEETIELKSASVPVRRTLI